MNHETNKHEQKYLERDFQIDKHHNCTRRGEN